MLWNIIRILDYLGRVVPYSKDTWTIEQTLSSDERRIYNNSLKIRNGYIMPGSWEVF